MWYECCASQCACSDVSFLTSAATKQNSHVCVIYICSVHAMVCLLHVCLLRKILMLYSSACEISPCESKGCMFIVPIVFVNTTLIEFCSVRTLFVAF